MKKNPFLQILTEKNFLKLWGSQMLSQATLNLLNFMIILRIFESTGSTIAISLVWIFYALPAILLGPFSGTLIDLWDKRYILIVTNFLQAITVLFYLFVKTKIWPIYSIIFLYSFLNQFYIPAEAATLPGIIPARLYPAANSLFLFTIYGAFLVGFGLAGPLIKALGRQTPFLLASLMLAMAGVCVVFLPRRKRRVYRKRIDFQDFWKRLQEGYRFLRRAPIVLLPLLLIVGAEITVSIVAVLSPAIAVKIIKIALEDASLVLVVPVGIGAIFGALAVVWLLKKRRKKQVISAALLLVSFCFFGLGLLVPNLEKGRIIAGIMVAFLAGVGFVGVTIPSQTLLQENTPKDLRGRVFGALGFLITLASLMPVLFSATVAEILGITWMILVLAVVIFVVGIVSWRREYVFSTRHRT